MKSGGHQHTPIPTLQPQRGYTSISPDEIQGSYGGLSIGKCGRGVRAGINVGEFPPIGYFAAKSPQSAGLQTVEIKQFQIITAVAFFLSFCFGKRTKKFCPNDGSRNFENTRNPGKKVGSPAYEPKRPPCRFCRISMCFQIHRLSGTAFGRARALR